MAQLKDLIVNGATRLIGKLTTQEAQILTLDAPETSGSSTFGPGTNGLVLKTNGSSLYWGTDNDHITTATTTGSGNAVTAISADANGALTVTKGSTFLTSHLTIKLDGITGATINRYAECSTAAATPAKEATVLNGTFSLEKGVTVFVKFAEINSASSPTLNINNTGAKALKIYGTTAVGTGQNTNGWRAGAVVPFVYDGTNWLRMFWENSTYYTDSIYCATAASTAAKVGTISYWTNNSSTAMPAGMTFLFMMVYTNTAASPTLNIGSTGAKSVYINGVAANASNWIRGLYTAYWDGTSYYLRNNGLAGHLLGTGLTRSGETINHSNSVTALTTLALYPIKIDAQGHISGYGSAITSLAAASSGTDVSLVTTGEKYTWNNKTSNVGTVTSVRVQATSPVTSSTSTAQSSSLDTTIALADNYGDTKNPYASKTKNYVLAAPSSANGVPSFRKLVSDDIPIMTGATSSADGKSGAVPAPETIGYNLKYLRADGSWEYPSMKFINYTDSSTNLSLTASDANSCVQVTVGGTILLPDESSTFPAGTRLVVVTAVGAYVRVTSRTELGTNIVIPGERSAVHDVFIPGRLIAEFIRSGSYFYLVSGSIPQVIGSLTKSINAADTTSYTLDYRDFNNIILVTVNSSTATVTLKVGKHIFNTTCGGYKYTIIKNGGGTVKIIPDGSLVLIRHKDLSSNTTGGKIGSNRGIVTLYCYLMGSSSGADVWYAEGDLVTI